MDSKCIKTSDQIKASGFPKKISTKPTLIPRVAAKSNLRTSTEKWALSRGLKTSVKPNHIVPIRTTSSTFGETVIKHTLKRTSGSFDDIKKDRDICNKVLLKPTEAILQKKKKLHGSTASIKNVQIKSNIVSTSSINKKGQHQQVVKKQSNLTVSSKIMVKRITNYDHESKFNDLLEKHKLMSAHFEQAKVDLSELENLSEQLKDTVKDLCKSKEMIEELKMEKDKLEEENKAQNLKIYILSKTLHNTKEQFDQQKEDYIEIKDKHKNTQNEMEQLRCEYESLTEKIDKVSTELAECKEHFYKSDFDRKKLHNEVIDLQGNIRVFCRVRPQLNTEKCLNLCNLTYIDEQSLEISNNSLLRKQNNKLEKHEFSFDHVFHSKSSQNEIFDMVSPLIQSALDGYNVCIFAYGQTGSGKTYTMIGDSDNLGIIPRTVDLLFEFISNYKRLGWVYEIRVTFLEIYNEILYDLLSDDNNELEIRMVSANNKTDIYVSNITEEVVSTANQLKSLIQLSNEKRATASTVGNERSSRSHAVTRIQIIGSHKRKNESRIGTINLVDLAGSESPKTSTRMDETKNINRSLSELSNVILALLQNQKHIPYRNSKLTHLLKPCLGGNSKTLMFINVSPLLDCYVESVKSL